MLDFDDAIYDKLLDLAIKRNIVSNCREYPSLVYGGEPDTLGNVARYLQREFSNPAFKCGLYVHFPFCTSRCSFCKYYSEINTDSGQLDDFLSSLERELDLYNLDFKNRRLENLFLGGGTPTILDESRTKRLFKALYKHFLFRDSAQKTIEGTPDSLTLSKLRLYKELGINRISIGLQSSNDHVLRACGRRHTVRDVYRAFELARAAGMDYIGTELIWGLPGESRQSCQKTLSDIIALSPDFIEGYLLTEGGRARIKRSCPLDATLQELIRVSRDSLLANGYRLAFEGNFLGFVKEGIPVSDAVNQNTDSLYRHRAFVLGVGPGASSHFSDRKYIIAGDLASYCDNLNKGISPKVTSLAISRDDYRRHYIISQIGFFREIYKHDYEEALGNALNNDFPAEFSLLKAQGIIQETPALYTWQFHNLALDHESFYAHIVRYWYNPEYIIKIVKKFL